MATLPPITKVLNDGTRIFDVSGLTPFKTDPVVYKLDEHLYCDDEGWEMFYTDMVLAGLITEDYNPVVDVIIETLKL